MPNTPQKKTSLLSFPETTKQVLHFQCATAMLPGVFVFKQVVADDIKKSGKNGKYRKGFNDERGPR